MLTSKEIIERTGISRATLNNYIGSGLVPRPQVLPPGPEHGAAPRIGYFPDDTVARIEAIQRMKREGWSISRIVGHFAARPGTEAPPAGQTAGDDAAPRQNYEAASNDAATPVRQPAGSGASDPRPHGGGQPDLPAPAAAPRLSLADTEHPAWLVNDAFRLVWINEPARRSPLSPWSFAPAGPGGRGTGSVFHHLLEVQDGRGGDALLDFHLAAAGAREVRADDLFGGLPREEAARLHARYGPYRQPAARPLVAQGVLPGSPDLPARAIHAVHFHEGVLFALAPQPSAPVAGASAAAPAQVPSLTPVAVLAGLLHDAAGLWVRLSAEEYFELLNEVASVVDAILRQHHGQPRGTDGAGLACFFLPRSAGNYLWDALAAAHRVREALRQVSQRWQARKGWDVELCLNIGIDAGQDWLGALGIGGAAELRVLGDASDRAGHLARCGRMGAILLTRNLVGNLAREERQRLTYGVPRPDGSHAEAPLLFTFARLAELAGPVSVPPGVADLPVAELLAVSPPDSPASGRGR